MYDQNFSKPIGSMPKPNFPGGGMGNDMRKPGGPKPFKPTTGGPMPQFQMPGMGNDMRQPGRPLPKPRPQAMQNPMLDAMNRRLSGGQ